MAECCVRMVQAAGLEGTLFAYRSPQHVRLKRRVCVGGWVGGGDWIGRGRRVTIVLLPLLSAQVTNGISVRPTGVEKKPTFLRMRYVTTSLSLSVSLSSSPFRC